MVNFSVCVVGCGLSSASNYDDVLGQLRQAGLDVDSLEVGTARPVRCRVEGMGREKRGWYSLHELVARDGNVLLVGDGAGFVNMLKIKGLHNALDSGRLAGEAIAGSLAEPEQLS